MDIMTEPRYDPAAIAAWIRCEAAGSQDRQGPAEELLAEHMLMSAVLGAMKEESGSLAAGRPLRVEFWSGVVDFIGNFVHLCHRAKEEEHFFPLLLKRGLVSLDGCEALRHEHTLAKDLTLNLCSAIEEGDWERVLRLASAYGGFMAPHMKREELELAPLTGGRLPPDEDSTLRQGFCEVEARALVEGGRRHYLELSRRLCRDAKVAHPLPLDA